MRINSLLKTLALLAVALPALFCASDKPLSGGEQWRVFYVAPIRGSSKSLPTEALRKSLASAVSSLLGGVLIMPPYTEPQNETEVFAKCGAEINCKEYQDMGVTDIVVALIGTDRDVVNLHIDLINKHGEFSYKVKTTAQWEKLKRYAALGLVSAVAESELASIEKKNKEKENSAGSAAFDAFNPIIEKSSAYNMALKIFSNKEVAPKKLPVAGGKYSIGKDEQGADYSPYKMVELSDFLIDETEVTALNYSLCVMAGACTEAVSYAKDQYCTFRMEGGSMLPINCVDWRQARDYCQFAGGRLPTEAEWEAAAKGTLGKSFPWGEDKPTECDKAVFSTSKGDGCGENMPMQTGALHAGASDVGALDMAGNVWEWTSDFYQKDAYKFIISKNPQGPSNGTMRVIRGGSWLSKDINELKTYYRGKRDPKTYSNAVGFRCAYSKPH